MILSVSVFGPAGACQPESRQGTHRRAVTRRRYPVQGRLPGTSVATVKTHSEGGTGLSEEFNSGRLTDLEDASELN